VHDAIRAALDPNVIRMLADAAEIPSVQGAASEKKSGKKQTEFLETGWGRCEELLSAVQATWSRVSGGRAHAQPMLPDMLAPAYRKCLRAVMRLLSVESLLPPPWVAAARRVLPNPSPQVSATALWGPVMGWCLIQVLAEAIDGEDRQRTALDMFDRLRLREPLAQAFNALGLEGEEGWRAAARIKILLLIESHAEAKKSRDALPRPEMQAADSQKLTKAETPAAETSSSTSTKPSGAGMQGATKGEEVSDSVIPSDLWKDHDVRWLTGFNEAEGHAYVVREPYLELLWWLSLPEILKLANMTVPTRTVGSAISKKIEAAVAAVERAGYRVDALFSEKTTDTDQVADQSDKATLKAAVGPKPGIGTLEPAPEDLEPAEPLAKQSVGPVNPEGPPEDD
jgi:hypothetical protein